MSFRFLWQRDCLRTSDRCKQSGSLSLHLPTVRNVLIIDDRPTAQKVLANIVAQAFQGVSVHCEGSIEAGQKHAARHERLDLVLINLGLGRHTDIDALISFRRKFAHVPVAVICPEDDLTSIIASLKAGAAGCIPSNFSASDIVHALRLIEGGRRFVPEQVISCLEPGAAADDFAKTAGELTERRRQVLRLVLKGRSNAKIAKELGIAHGTAKQHVYTIYKAIGVSSRTQLLALAVRGGIRRDRSAVTEAITEVV